ncbi:MAG TPA: CoA transferase [Pseudonocardia sp.]
MTGTTGPVTSAADEVRLPATLGRTDLPLSGVRVLDLTMVWAGPFGTKQLVDAGAQVIKVEGPGRTDLVRSLTIPDETVDRPWDTSRYFHEYNRNKLGIAVDVRQEAGRKILLDLAVRSDVLIDNFRPGVLDRLGLGWARLHELNPRLIAVSLPGYSGFEPERALPGYGPNIEQMSGLAHLQGYPGGPPQKSGISYGDPVGGLGGAAAVLTALFQRERTGVGTFVEAGQRNLLMGFVGDAIVAHQLGASLARNGNRSPSFAPQGVYPCAGADSWVALTVACDEQWPVLCDVLGRRDLAADPELACLPGRQAAHDRLDAEIGAWTRQHTNREVAQAMQARGIAASAVLGPRELADDPHLTAREFFREVRHPDLGTMRLTTPTWRFDEVEVGLAHAPSLGQHNRYVLREVLGYDDETVAELEAAGVVATRPANR